MRSRHPLTLVALESRVNPTVTIVTPTLAKYTDIDGDTAFVKVSSGVLTTGLFTTVATGLGEQLQAIDFSGGGFDNANLTVSVVKGAKGDGFANVGYVNSTNHDIGNVKIKGDLGQIDAGDATTTTVAIKSLNVKSLGRYGVDTQAAGGSLQSDINGGLGSLVVASDVKEAFVFVSAGADGNIGSVSIGGSLIGGSADNSGKIFASGGFGSIRINGDIRGGSGASSGDLLSFGKVASIRIGGSLIGGSNSASGYIASLGDVGNILVARDVIGGVGMESGKIGIGANLAGVTIGGSLIGGAGGNTGMIIAEAITGPIKIARDFVGSTGQVSGQISSIHQIGNITIGGSMIGASGAASARIQAATNIGFVKIGRNMLGGSGLTSGMIDVGQKIAGVTIGGNFMGGSVGGTDSLDLSGVIRSGDAIGPVVVGGSVISGNDESTGTLTRSTAIICGAKVGSIRIAGNVLGNTGLNGDSPVMFVSNDGFGSITVGGRVENTRFLAGYGFGNLIPNPTSGDAQIGAVRIGKDWVASSIVAGVSNTASNNASFGDANDALIGAGVGSRIASVRIGGLVYGTPAASGADHFGFSARHIGSFRSLGFVAPLTAGTDAPIELALSTGDVTIREF